MIPVITADQIEHDLRQKLAPFLHRIQPGRPEQNGSIGVLIQPEHFLQLRLVCGFSCHHIFYPVMVFDMGIGFRAVRFCRSIQNTGGAACVVFLGDLPLDLGRHKVVTAFHDLFQEGGAHRIDKVSRKDPAGQEVHRIGGAAFFIIVALPSPVR